MNTYIAKIIYQIVSGEGQHTPQFDEQLRLVEARSDKEALTRARELGQRGEDTFLNARKEMVRWQFIGVTDLKLISEMRDGAELYSRVEEAGDAQHYIHAVKQKARTIETLSNFEYIF